MKKEWSIVGEGKYLFCVNNIQLGEMEITLNSIDSIATCQIEDKEFTIRRKGFWKSSIDIVDNGGKIIAKTYIEKWYANSSVLEFDDKKYKLILHNNPLAEYSIIDDGKNLVSYGLAADNGKVNTRITGEDNHSNYLFDFLLWYLFVPIATENMGDNFTFQTLLNAQ